MKASELMPRNNYELFVNGRFIPASSGMAYTTINPATGEFLAHVAAAGAEDVDKAIKAAQKAFLRWKKINAGERADILLRIANKVEEEREFLAVIETLDSGKPLRETREDVTAVIDHFRYFAGCIRTQEGSFIQHSEEAFSMLVREPLGVVGQIIPWNFPLLMAGWKLAPALAAGNCVVIKPASSTPLSLLELAGMLQDILFPGVLNVLTGSGSECGQPLAEHPGIRKIGFTGSTETGSHLAATAGSRIIPITLELGGKSANIVFEDAPMEKAVDGAAAGILYSQGQVCSAGSRLFLHESIYDEFLDRLVEKFNNVKIGNPLEPDVTMGPLIDEKQLKKVLSYVELGEKEGARLLYGGKRLTGGDLNKGFYMQPTIFTEVNSKMRIAREEIFGPVLVVIKFKEEAEAIEMANDSPYGLAGAVWSGEINRALKVAAALEAGTVWINDYNAVPAHSPFGGYKDSGFGRECHKMALEAYSQLKNIYVNTAETPAGLY